MLSLQYIQQKTVSATNTQYILIIESIYKLRDVSIDWINLAFSQINLYEIKHGRIIPFESMSSKATCFSIIIYTMSIKDFSILAKLGEGAYSTVYKVERLADRQQYALKKVKLGNLSDKQADNALNQVRILASIHHPNIVSYKQAFLQGKSLWSNIVMEFADDGDLYHKISEQKKKKKYFQQSLIWATLIHIIRGLKELHTLKILHRDIKTANVFLKSDSTAQLGDMNVSKIAENGLLYTQTGTPYYASPEVWSEQPYDSKSDIWSLGCVIYEMTALEVPFKAEDMQGLAKSVLTGKYDPIPNVFSKELNQLISYMLQLKPKSRPSCDKLLKYTTVQRKIEQMNLGNDKSAIIQNQLLETIKMPKKLQYLTDRLPKSNYSFSHSFNKGESPPQKPRRQQRQRTNTLPKLQRVVRYHEEEVHRRRKKENHSINKSNLLCVEGVPKNINDVHAQRPDRRDKIQQEIKRIYQGKHAVNMKYDSRANLLPTIGK